MKKLLVLVSAILPSVLRVFLLRACGVRIGRGVRLGWLSVLHVDNLTIGDGTTISPLCFVRAHDLVLGKRVYIGSLTLINTVKLFVDDDSRISRFVIVSAGQLNAHSALIIGKRVSVYPFCWIDTTREVTMQDEAGIGGGTYIFTHGSWQPNIDGYPVAFGAVTIERGVWLPWRVFILPNVTIGEYATIGAGAVINKSIPAYSLAGGIPAKVIKADGEHVRRLSIDEKIELVRKMLRESVDQLRFEGFSVTLTDSPDEITLETDAGRVIFRSAFERLPDTGRERMVIISWERFPDAMLMSMEARGAAWIDFARRRCAEGDDPLFEAIRGIFSIHGVRFEPTSSADAVRLPDVERSKLG